MEKMFDPQWYVVYTMPKSEKKVAESISGMGIESYLPMHKVIRQWSDRKKKLEVPLFPSYVFVKVNETKRVSLFSIKELIRFVSIEKKPVVVREKVIMNIKRVLSEDVQVATEEYFQEGMRVRIGYGQFAGMEGVIIKKNNSTRLVVKIDGLMKAFSFNIASHVVETVTSLQV